MEIEIRDKKFEIKPHQSIPQNKQGKPYKDFSDIAITRDEEKCIGCAACHEACVINNGLEIPVETEVENCLYFRPDGKLEFKDSHCTRCGQCVIACPTGCLSEKDNIADVEKAIADPNKIVIAQMAPSVRVSVGGAFGKDSAQNMEGEIVAALRKIGFDYIFDVNVGADFTTYEEAYDLKERIENGQTPMFTSCCPARVKFIEDFHPELIPNITTVRSPQQCLAVLIKTYFAREKKIDPKDIVVVSIMPCIAKKFESRRSGEDKSFDSASAKDHWFDVDWVLTTREFIKMAKARALNLAILPKEKFDSLFGEASGAGAIYGASGGVVESAVRTLADIMGDPLDKLGAGKIEWQQFRGMEGVKKATLNIAGKEVNIAVTSGLDNAEKIIREMNSPGGVKYDYVEVMACPGGCVGGGGQPKPAKQEIIDARRKALYMIDNTKTVRKAHENPVIKRVYDEFLGHPGGAQAKKYLHTDYDMMPVREKDVR